MSAEVSSRHLERLKRCCLAVLCVLLLPASCFCADDLHISPEELQIIKQAEERRADVIERVYGSVVSVFGEVKDGKKEGGGSGVIFDPAGFALTNHHVVAAAGPKGKAGLSDGKLYDWKLVGTDPAGDIAVIQLLGKEEWPTAPLGDSTAVQVGDFAMAMGNPFVLAENYQPTVTMGIVSGVERYQGGGMVYGNCIQVDSAINPGNSGGPLMNMQGEVIGINGRAAFAERGRVNVGVGFAVSMQQIKNFLPDLLAGKVAQHGTLDAQFGMRDGKVICEAINLDGRAARAGLELGDRLISVNGTEIQNANQLASLISMMPAGWPVRVAYEHKGKEFAFSIRLSALTSFKPAQPPVDSEDPEPKPHERQEEDSGDKEQESESDEPQRNKKDEGPEKKLRRGPKLPRLIPGSILSKEVNRENTQRILGRWLGDPGDNESNLAGVLGGMDFVIEANGCFQVGQVGRDENGFYQLVEEEKTDLATEKALDDNRVLAAVAVACQRDSSIVESFGIPSLDGGDLIDGLPVARLKFTTQTRDPLYLWLTTDQAPKLLQIGFDRNGTLARSVLKLDESVQRNGFVIPKVFHRVVGVGRKVRESIELTLDVPLGDETVAAPVPIKSPNAFSQAVDFAQRRVVKIYGAKVGRTPGYASGILVGDSGEILTANGTHLNGERIRVVLPDGSSHLAEPLQRSRAKQLALLKIDAATQDFFSLEDQIGIFKGQSVLAISNLFKIADGADASSVMLGIVALQTKLEAKRGNRPFPYEGDVILLDCISSNPGSPGGAVVDSITGSLIGMIGPNLESRSSGTKLNYALPIHVLRSFMSNDDVAATPIASASDAKPYIGVRLFRVGGKKSPAYVDRVRRNSPAGKAGLRPDDVVIGLGDERIRTIEDYDGVFSKLVPGEEVDFAFKRGSRLLRAKIVVGEMAQ